MRCFLKYSGLLLIIAGVVLLVVYTTQNRIDNIHFVIAGVCELFGLILYVITNKFIDDKKKEEQC